MSVLTPQDDIPLKTDIQFDNSNHNENAIKTNFCNTKPYRPLEIISPFDQWLLQPVSCVRRDAIIFSHKCPLSCLMAPVGHIY